MLLLFSLFLADMEHFFRERGAIGVNVDGFCDVLMLMYADDLVILSDSAGDMQRKLCLLEMYTSQNNLEVNINKTKVMCFRRSPRPINNVSLLLNDVRLEMVGQYNYLGVIFSSSSLFYGMIQHSVSKASISVGSVMSLFGRSKVVSWEARMRLYESIVLNSISHCIPVWSLRYFEMLERIQVKFYKTLLHLPRCTPDYAVRLETGVLPVAFLIFKISLTWLSKMLSMEANRLPRICFLRLLQLRHNDRRYNWALQLENIFLQISESDIWRNLSAQTLKCSKHRILKKYEELLRCTDISAASSSTFLLFPSLLPNNLDLVPSQYLTWKLPIYITRVISQLRMCNVRGVKLSSAGSSFFIDFSVSCTLCNLQRNETLFHMFLECPVYEPIRTSFLREIGPAGLFARLNMLDVRGAKIIAAFVATILKIRAFIINE